MKQDLYTIQEVSTLLGVSPKTLRRWEEAGLIKPIRTAGNQRRYRVEDIKRLERRRQLRSIRQSVKNEIVPLPARTSENAASVSSRVEPVSQPVPQIIPQQIPSDTVMGKADIEPRIGELQDKKGASSAAHSGESRVTYYRKKFFFPVLGALSSIVILACALTLWQFAGYPGLHRDVKGVRTYNARQAVLADTSRTPVYQLDVNIPSLFAKPATFLNSVAIKKGLTVKGLSVLNGGIKTNNANINAGIGKLTASNVLYSIHAGSNITISGDRQNPTISAGVSLTAGNGLNISGSTISNSDLGSAQDIFKKFTIGSTDITAGSNSDTVTFAAGSGISLSGNASTKTITITSSGSSSSSTASDTFWQDNSGFLAPTTLTDNLLLGSKTASTANFAFINNDTGTPTMTIAATSGGNTAYLTGTGILATTGLQALQLGSSTTGNISVTTGAIASSSGTISIQSGDSSIASAGNVSVDTGSSVVSGTVIENRTFESGIENFVDGFGHTDTLAQSSAQAHGGSNSLSITTGGGGWSIGQSAPYGTAATAGHTYVFSAYARADTTGSNIIASVDFSTNGFGGGGSVEVDQWGTATDNSSGWTHITGTLVAPAGTNFIGLSFQDVTAGSGTVHYLDDITVTDLNSGATTAALNLGATNAQTVTLGNAAEIGATNIYAGGGGINIASGLGTIALTSGGTTITAGGASSFTTSKGALTLTGAASSTWKVTAGNLTLQPGVETGSNNGGNLILNGGLASGTGQGGSVIVTPLTDTNTAFQVQNAAGSRLFTISSTTTSATASISANTDYAGLVVNQAGIGDILTASTGGFAKFTIKNDGSLVSGKYIVNNGLLYTDGNGLFNQLTPGSNGDCLVMNGGNLGWGSCTTGLGSNFWQEITGTLSPANISDDLLLGGTSTNSAKFAFINNAPGSGTPTASISGSTAGSALYLTGDGTLGTVNKGTLTIGSASTGDIVLNGFTGANSVLYTQSGTGVLNAAVTGTPSECLVSGAGGPSWQSCPTGSGSSNWTQDLSSGVLYPNLSPLDVLFGGTSTASAKFAFINNAPGSGTPTASISAITTNNALTIDANGNIGTTNRQTLTLGTPTTGDINLFNFGAGALQTDANGNISTGTLGVANGGTGNNWSGVPQGSIPYFSAAGTMSTFGPGSSGQILQSNGPGSAPGWISTSSINYWGLAGGVLSPLNLTNDLILGGSSTSSAKFGFLNNAGGSPTASIAGNLSIVSPTGVNPAATFNVLNGGSLNFQTSPGGDAGLASRLYVANNGSIGIGTTNPAFFTLQVAGNVGPDANNTYNLGSTSSDWSNVYARQGNFRSGLQVGSFGATVGTGTTPSATIAANTAFAGLIVDNTGTGDLFTASKSGATKFVIDNAGNVTINNLITKGGILYTNGSGTVTQTIQGNSGQILESAGVSGTPTWVDASTVGVNYWQSSAGALSPLSITNDLLLGGTSTSSAKFGFLNNAGGNPTASMAGNLSIVSPTGTNPAETFNILNGGSLNFRTSPGGDAGLNSALYIANNGYVGIGTTSPLNVLSVQATSGAAMNLTTPANAPGDDSTIQYNNRAIIGYEGDIAAAVVRGESGKGVALEVNNSISSIPFFIDQNQHVMIGQNAVENELTNNIAPSASLTVGGDASMEGQLVFYTTPIIQSSDMQTLTLGGATTGDINFKPAGTSRLYLASSGNVGIGTTRPVAPLQVNGAYGGNAAAIINQQNSGDIFTASASGTTQFTIAHNGTLTLANYNNCGALTTTGTTLTCAGTPSGTNFWNQILGALTPQIETQDLLIGGTATNSAKFAVLNMAAGTPLASVAGNLTISPYTSGNTQQGGVFTLNGQQGDNLQILETGNNMRISASSGIFFLNAANGHLVAIGAATAVGGLDAGLTTYGNDTFTRNNNSTNSFVINNSSGTTLLQADTLNMGIGIGTSNFGNDSLVVNQANSSGDIFSASQAGNTKFVINNSGNVGIGTTNPIANLQIGAQASTATPAWVFAAAASSNVNGNALLVGNWQSNNLWGFGPGTNIAGDNTVRLGITSSNASNVWNNTQNIRLVVNGTLGSSALAALDVHAADATSPVASFSAQTTNAALVVDNSGTGDLFTASAAGATKFVIKNSGRVGIGTATPFAQLEILGDLGNTPGILFNNTSRDIAYDTGEALRIGTYNVANGNWTEKAQFDANGNLGIGTAAPVAPLHVNGAYGGNAAAIVNQQNSGDIFTASASGITKFTIANSGTLSLANYNNCGALTTTGTTLVCSGTPSGTNFWNQILGALTPQIETQDLLIGGTSTASAKFAVINVNSGTPTASISGASNNALALTATGTISTTNGETLTLGAAGTGNIVLAPNGTPALTATGTNLVAAGTLTGLTGLTSSGTITFSNLGGTGVVQSNSSGILSSGALNLAGGASYITGILPVANGGAPFEQNNGAINERIANQDLLLGGTATASAKFGFINVNSGTPTASISAVTGTKTALSFGADGSIQSVNMNTLTLGGATTGNIILNPANGAAGGYIAPGVDNVTDLGASSSGRFRNLFLGPGSLHIQCNSGTCGQSVDYAMGVLTSGAGKNSLYISANGNSNAQNALFTVTQGGYIGIGTTNPAQMLQLYGGAGINAGLEISSNNGNTNQILKVIDGANSGLQIQNGNGVAILQFDNNHAGIALGSYAGVNAAPSSGLIVSGNVGLGTAVPVAPLHVNGAYGSNAAAIINQQNSGDIFTASQSGNTKFTIDNSGNVTTVGNLVLSNNTATTQFGGHTYTWQTAALTNGYVLQTNGTGTLTWIDPGTLPSSNFFQQVNGVITPKIETQDLLLGGTATSSAKFAVLNMNGGTPVASVAGNFIVMPYTSGTSELGGKMGIGTNAPTNTLDINSEGSSNGFRLTGSTSDLFMQLNNTSGNDWYLDSGANNSLNGPGYFTIQPLLGSPILSLGTAASFNGSGGALGINVPGLGANAHMQATIDIRAGNSTLAVASISGATTNAAEIVDQSGTGDIFTASKSGATKFTVKNSGTVIIGNTTNGIQFDPTATATCSGGSLFAVFCGNARPTKQIVLTAEYPGAVITASGSAHTTGFMTSDASPSASANQYNFENYYMWDSTDNTNLNDYTVAVEVTLPKDFSAWPSSGNAITIDFNTGLTTSAQNALDVYVYKKGVSNTGIPVYFSTNNVSTSVKTWKQITITKSQLEGTTTWNQPGDQAVIYLKMKARDNTANYVQVGDIDLNYLSGF